MGATAGALRTVTAPQQQQLMALARTALWLATAQLHTRGAALRVEEPSADASVGAGVRLLSCTNASATSLTVQWAPVDATDLYYVALSSVPLLTTASFMFHSSFVLRHQH